MKPLRCKVWPSCIHDRYSAAKYTRFLRQHGIRRVVYTRQADAILVVATNGSSIEQNGFSAEQACADMQAMHVANRKCRFLVVANESLIPTSNSPHIKLKHFWAYERNIPAKVLAAIKQARS